MVRKLSLVLSFSFFLDIFPSPNNPYFWLRDYYSANTELLSYSYSESRSVDEVSGCEAGEELEFGRNRSIAVAIIVNFSLFYERLNRWLLTTRGKTT
jgi:hypothetical protein